MSGLNPPPAHLPLEVTSKDVTITPALEDLTRKKFARLNRYIDHIMHVHITFHVQNKEQTAKAHLRAPGAEFQASYTSRNLYESIDRLLDDMVAQLKKHREKQTDHRQ